MMLPEGSHYNVVFEPSQISNGYEGSFVVGYLFPDGPFGKRIEQYREPVREETYRAAVKLAHHKWEPWQWLFDRFKPPTILDASGNDSYETYQHIKAGWQDYLKRKDR